MTRTYIGKNSSRVDLYNAYKKAIKELKQQKWLNSKRKGAKSKVIQQKNEKYNKVSWELFKKNQLVYGKDIHIRRLQGLMLSKTINAKKAGYEEAMKKIKKKDTQIINMYRFLHLIDRVTNIIGLSLNECSFLLWCGMYDFYTTLDYKRDCGDLSITFYSVNARMIKKGYVTELDQKERNKKVFTLSGTGLNMFNKIDNFTKKHLSSNGKNRRDLRDKVQDTSAA